MNIPLIYWRHHVWNADKNILSNNAVDLGPFREARRKTLKVSKGVKHFDSNWSSVPTRRLSHFYMIPRHLICYTYDGLEQTYTEIQGYSDEIWSSCCFEFTNSIPTNVNVRFKHNPCFWNYQNKLAWIHSFPLMFCLLLNKLQS